MQSKLVRLEPQASLSSEIAEELSLTVFDQPEACKAVGKRLAMFETNLTDPNRPLGVLYFLGQPGTGKTEMAHAAAKYMFNDANSSRLKKLNMSEFSEAHYAARLTGSPPGYVDHDQPPVIPHDWLHSGRSIILFDEVEKAHPIVHKTLLSIMDRGTLDARDGRRGVETLDFRNALIILTSNVASAEISQILAGRKGIGFGAKEADKQIQIKEAASKGLKSKFPPEFIDRIDEVVVFEPLDNPETLNAIITKFIGERNDYLKDTLEKRAPFIGLTTEARDFIVSKSKGQGGREIKKLLETHVFEKFADVVSGMDYRGKPFVADIENGKTSWYTDDSVFKEEPIKALTVVPELKKKDRDTEGDAVGAPSGDGTNNDDSGGDGKKKEMKAKIIGGDLTGMMTGDYSGRVADVFVRVRSHDGEKLEGMVFNVKLGVVT